MPNNIIQIIRNDTGEIYTFQSVSALTSSATSTITNNPTSEGTPRTDNIYSNPAKFTVSVQIGGSENITDEWGVGTDRPRNAYSLLKYIKDRAVELSIITPQADYLHMYLTSINLDNSVTNAYNFSAGLQFNELLLATFKTTTVGPFLNNETAANSSSAQSNGNNAGDENNNVNQVILDNLDNDIKDYVDGTVKNNIDFLKEEGGENLFKKYANDALDTYVILINDNVPQTFTHRFNDGRVFMISLKYNRPLDNWSMDILLRENQTYIPQALNTILQSGLNLLSQYKYLNLGEFYVFTYNPEDEYSPSYNTLNKYIYVWRHS